MVIEVFLCEVGKDGHTLEAPVPSVGVVAAGIGVPSMRVVDGIEHLGQVLHVFLVLAKALRHIVYAVVLRDFLNVGLGQCRDANPVGIFLLLRTEGRAHAHPKFFSVLLVPTRHHIAKAVVSLSREVAVVAHAALAIDNLREVAYLLDVDLDFGKGLAVVGLGVDEAAHVGIAPGVGAGLLGDVALDEVVEALHGGAHVVGVHDAHSGAFALGNAVDGLEGLVFVVLCIVAGRYELAYYAPELICLLHFLLCLLLRSLAVVVIIVAAGGDEIAEAQHHGGHQPIME